MGKWYLVTPVALAAVAAGAHRLLIEVHPNPDVAKCDGPQALTFENFDLLMAQMKAPNSIRGCRYRPNSSTAVVQKRNPFVLISSKDERVSAFAGSSSATQPHPSTSSGRMVGLSELRYSPAFTADSRILSR